MNISTFNSVTVDVAALAANYRLLRGQLSEQTRLMAMVKSDAYGHGMVDAAAAFASAGCLDFGVAELFEGVELREAGCTGEIFVFVGFDHEQVDYFFSHRLIPVVYRFADLDVLNRAAKQRNQKLAFFVKFDCGMARLGFSPDQVQQVRSRIDACDCLEFRGIMSHYPCADDRVSDNTPEVYDRFANVAASLALSEGMVASICNSGGGLYFPATHGDMVRAGIALYGYYPDGAEGRARVRGTALQPAMQVSTRVIQVRDVKAGSGISYGHTYRAARDMRLAVLPFGYSNGYFRILSNRAEVLIRGQRAPIRGRICMNMCMVDVSAIDGASEGDEAILLGTQGNETIDADELAALADTISYEIVCMFGNNNQRLVVDSL